MTTTSNPTPPNTNPPMYQSLEPLDRQHHRNLKMKEGVSPVPRAAGLNSLFLAVVEFADACKEFPIVFVPVGAAPTDGSKQAIAPLAVLGLTPGTNLFVKDGVWTGRYQPAYLRRYPFVMARLEGVANDSMAVCIDSEWEGFSETEGLPLFNDKGEATDVMTNAHAFTESFEREAERTRAACDHLLKYDLLQEMRFEATLPDGNKLNVEGFLAVDEKKLAELPDASVLEMHRNGLLGLIEMHRVSMGNMARLADMQAALKNA